MKLRDPWKQGGGSKSRVGGFSHEVLLGVLPRLAGADATIFPSFGGRFGFSVEECKGILSGSRRPMGTYPTIFPSPGGGMTLERVAAMNEVYGEDIMLLIGGSLMGHSPDLVANSKHFMAIAGRKDLYGYGHKTKRQPLSFSLKNCFSFIFFPIGDCNAYVENIKSETNSTVITCHCCCFLFYLRVRDSLRFGPRNTRSAEIGVYRPGQELGTTTGWLEGLQRRLTET